MAEDFRGKLGGMMDEERDAFLAGDSLARLACLKPDGSPYVIPVWYQWDGESIWFVGRQRSIWCEYIKNDGRVSAVIDAPHSPPDESGKSTEIPKVFMEGTAEVVEEPNVGGQWVQVAEEMSYRYLGPNGPTYLTGTINQPRWLIKLTPSKIKTWQGVGWARKYWVEGTGGATYEEAHGG
jgi:nitroimidazol reductase NimA-like FMN-containing flavoprotein (pyridoxamine 5'-phosphate oxidase superfamily)